MAYDFMEEVGRALLWLQRSWRMPISNKDCTVQAFPSFGMERKGAAVSAFVRLDTIPIVERGEIKHPSSVIVLDSSLLHKVDITQGAKPDALILLSCKEHENHVSIGGSFRVAGVDAAKIALQYGLGSRWPPS